MDQAIRKVTAYITNGRRLLVFEQPAFPEAGIQVPSGTIDAGESPLSAVLRESQEETGLGNLVLCRYLGLERIDRAAYGKSGCEVRTYFHLICPGKPPAKWSHMEMSPSEGSPDPIEFSFYWVPGPQGIPPLAGFQGARLTAIDWNSLPAEGWLQ